MNRQPYSRGFCRAPHYHFFNPLAGKARGYLGVAAAFTFVATVEAATQHQLPVREMPLIAGPLIARFGYNIRAWETASRRKARANIWQSPHLVKLDKHIQFAGEGILGGGIAYVGYKKFNDIAAQPDEIYNEANVTSVFFLMVVAGYQMLLCRDIVRQAGGLQRFLDRAVPRNG